VGSGVQPNLPPPVIVSAATLPRVTFGPRLLAALLDLVLVGFFTHILHLSGLFLLIYTAYCVILWKLKATTIGGIICGLKLVRIDDRPIDWGIALIRALGAFLSLIVIGLGFLWVNFDEDCQSWHDKIAGTTIVRVPKGHSLV
ncbi:MAG TPA: RDD family protein, partial [Opitutaceae bacterium]